MSKQYELWEEFQERKILDEEIRDITDAIKSGNAPDEIKGSIESLAKSIRRMNPSEISKIPIEESVFNYDPKDRLDIMKDRIGLYLGHSTEGMTPRQVYAKYLKSLEPERYRKKD